MPATTDRGEIMHAAGRARLSPALRDGVPSLLPPGDVADRCGWEPFFAALAARGLAVAWDDEGPAALRVVPRGSPRDAP